MALEQVKNEILEEAQNKAKEIALEGKKEKEKIIEEGQEKAEGIKEETDREIEKEKVALKKEELSNARMEGKQMQVRTKEEIINNTFQEFEETIQEKVNQNPAEFVKSCLEKTEFEIGLVQGDERFKEHIENEGYSYEEQDKEGIVIISENKEKRMDYSVEKILTEFKNQYRKNVAKILFS